MDMLFESCGHGYLRTYTHGMEEEGALEGEKGQAWIQEGKENGLAESLIALVARRDTRLVDCKVRGVGCDDLICLSARLFKELIGTICSATEGHAQQHYLAHEA